MCLSCSRPVAWLLLGVARKRGRAAYSLRSGVRAALKLEGKLSREEIQFMAGEALDEAYERAIGEKTGEIRDCFSFCSN